VKKIDEEMMHAQVSFIVSLSFILLLLWALLGGISGLYFCYPSGYDHERTRSRVLG
jgi:hypothetical protein